MSQDKPLVRVGRHDGVAVLTWSNSPVNAFGAQLLLELDAALTGLLEDPDIAAIVLQGSGSGFSAGADIREFGGELPRPSLGEIAQKIHESRKLTVAVMHGYALGGGLELALACKRRIGGGDCRFAFPEVNLGLIPGGGGTQRLPRLVGIRAARDLLLSGREIDADEALRIGLVDALLAPQHSTAEVLDSVRRELQPSRKRDSLARTRLAALLEETLPLGLEQGLVLERQVFADCMKSPEREGLVHASQAERRLLRDAQAQEHRIQTVGVIGGGTMGAGIAVAVLQAGLDVVLLERDGESLQRGVAKIEGTLEKQVESGTRSAAEADALLSRLAATTAYEDMAAADLVIEAAFEDMAVKKAVFAALDRVCKTGAILATNTSYLDVNELARSVSRSADVVGLHFFSPAHVMRLLEIVIPETASAAVVDRCFALARALGKLPVRSGVCDGFIGNRILYVYRQALSYMLEDGASPYQMDSALEAFGFAMGPYRTADLTGGDISWATRKRKAATRPAHERYVRIPDLICERGWLGQKTGKGYYVYGDGSRRGREHPEVLELIAQERSARGITPRAFSDEEIVDRYMAALINEAAKVLQEGIARRPSDIDVVFLHGYGFPRWRGGPLKYADSVGIQTIVDRLRTYQRDDERFWEPAALLLEFAENGHTLSSLRGSIGEAVPLPPAAIPLTSSRPASGGNWENVR